MAPLGHKHSLHSQISNRGQRKIENEYLSKGTEIHGNFLTYTSLEAMTNADESQQQPNQILYSVHCETLSKLK